MRLLHLGTGGGELAKALELAAHPRQSPAMANSDCAPEELGDQNRPEVAGRIVTGREQDLIACHAAHRFRMPAAERGAPEVDRPGVGNVASGNASGGAAQPEIDVLQIGFEGFLEQADLAENLGAVEDGRPWGRGDIARLVEGWSIAVPSARAPGGGAATGQVKGSIEEAGWAEDLAGGERGVDGGELFQVVGGEGGIGVEDGGHRVGGVKDGAIDGVGESGIATQGDHARATVARQIGRAVGGAVVDDQQLGGGAGLRFECGEEARQQVAAIPHGHDGADVHRKKRFLNRSSRFCTPSPQRLSLVSPTREVYMMEISPKRIRESRKASILISSLKPMPSDSSFICWRMERRKTHIPDCESRTQRKKRRDMARDRPRLPISLIRLMPRRSRTGKREALRKSTPR